MKLNLEITEVMKINEHENLGTVIWGEKLRQVEDGVTVDRRDRRGGKDRHIGIKAGVAAWRIQVQTGVLAWRKVEAIMIDRKLDKRTESKSKK